MTRKAIQHFAPKERGFVLSFVTINITLLTELNPGTNSREQMEAL
jgi:hypothetical protein